MCDPVTAGVAIVGGAYAYNEMQNAADDAKQQARQAAEEAKQRAAAEAERQRKLEEERQARCREQHKTGLHSMGKPPGVPYHCVIEWICTASFEPNLYGHQHFQQFIIFK